MHPSAYSNYVANHHPSFIPIDPQILLDNYSAPQPDFQYNVPPIPSERTTGAFERPVQAVMEEEDGAHIHTPTTTPNTIQVEYGAPIQTPTRKDLPCPEDGRDMSTPSSALCLNMPTPRIAQLPYTPDPAVASFTPSDIPPSELGRLVLPLTPLPARYVSLSPSPIIPLSSLVRSNVNTVTMQEVTQNLGLDMQNSNPGGAISIRSAIVRHYENCIQEGHTSFISDDGMLVFPINEASLQGYSRAVAPPNPEEDMYDGEFYSDGASDDDEF